MTTKKETTKQSSSEKKMFAEIEELRKAVENLRVKVGYMDEHLTAAQKNVARINARLEALEQTNREVEFLAMHEKMHEVHRAMRNIPTDYLINQKLDKPKPEDYVLTDADWQRVIKEQWLCEFTHDGEVKSIASLASVKNIPTGKRFDPLDRGFAFWISCRPLNKPGVMQPYFGQGMPVKAGVKVLVKQRNGLYCIGKALEQDWHIMGCSSDIVSFTILE